MWDIQMVLHNFVDSSADIIWMYVWNFAASSRSKNHGYSCQRCSSGQERCSSTHSFISMIHLPSHKPMLTAIYMQKCIAVTSHSQRTRRRRLFLTPLIIQPVMLYIDRARTAYPNAKTGRKYAWRTIGRIA